MTIKEVHSVRTQKFQVQTARPLPIIVLADTSGSMSVDGKIEALNKSLKDMISSFAGESRLRAELQVSLITFGSQAEVNLPLTPAHQLQGFTPLTAAGRLRWVVLWHWPAR